MESSSCVKLCQALTLTLFMLIGAVRVSAQAACPADIDACLGNASQFAVVANRVKLKATFENDGYGNREGFNTTVGAVCSNFAYAEAAQDAPTVVLGNLVIGAASAQAGAFVAYRLGDMFNQVLNEVRGTLVTNGTSVYGASAVIVDGGLDSSGANPQLTDCQNALADAQTASEVLRGLAPTQELGKISLRGHSRTIEGVSGVNVLHATAIRLKPRMGVDSEGRVEYYSVLHIRLPDPASVAILNIDKAFVLAKDCQIDVQNGRAIINVPGPGSPVRIGRDTLVPDVVAPQRRVSLHRTYIGHVFAKTVAVNGAAVGAY